jgi:hypothetical protein
VVQAKNASSCAIIKGQQQRKALRRATEWPLLLKHLAVNI